MTKSISIHSTSLLNEGGFSGRGGIYSVFFVFKCFAVSFILFAFVPGFKHMDNFLKLKREISEETLEIAHGVVHSLGKCRPGYYHGHSVNLDREKLHALLNMKKARVIIYTYPTGRTESVISGHNASIYLSELKYLLSQRRQFSESYGHRVLVLIYQMRIMQEYTFLDSLLYLLATFVLLTLTLIMSIYEIVVFVTTLFGIVLLTVIVSNIILVSMNQLRRLYIVCWRKIQSNWRKLIINSLTLVIEHVLIANPAHAAP